MQSVTPSTSLGIPFPIPTTVTRKGQITIPVSIREALDIQEGDTIAVALQDDKVTLTPVTSTLAAGYQSLPALPTPMDWKDVRRIAQEDHVAEVMNKQ